MWISSVSFWCRRSGRRATWKAKAVQAGVFAAFKADLAHDVETLSSKIYIDQPALSDGDGEIMKFRRWARQFRVDDELGKKRLRLVPDANVTN